MGWNLSSKIYYSEYREKKERKEERGEMRRQYYFRIYQCQLYWHLFLLLQRESEGLVTTVLK